MTVSLLTRGYVCYGPATVTVNDISPQPILSEVQDVSVLSTSDASSVIASSDVDVNITDDTQEPTVLGSEDSIIIKVGCDD